MSKAAHGVTPAAMGNKWKIEIHAGRTRNFRGSGVRDLQGSGYPQGTPENFGFL
jgi:hypothetical protein